MLNHENFGTTEQNKTNIAVDYYEGCQKTHLIKMMNGLWEHGAGTRDEWKERGLVPRTRNIVKSIVDKSGLLFNKPPTLSVLSGNTPEEEPTLNELLRGADWIEFFQNVDVYTRLLKATVVLAQRYIPNETETQDGVYRFNANNGEGLILHLLHQGNCAVEKDPLGNILELAYLINLPDEYKGQPDSENWWAYRRITADLIQDWVVRPQYAADAKEELAFEEANVEGVVPAVMFYDTAKPTKAVFPHLPEDLCSLQEMYNLHLTDTEFAIAWQKVKTLFMDTEIDTSDGMEVHNHHEDYVEDSYSVQSNTQPQTNIGGLGSIVKLANDGEGKSPFIEFAGPETNLKPLDDIINQLVTSVSADWDVNVKSGGKGSATSGFQLIVEEINNLSLREKRAHFMTTGLRSLYSVLTVLYPELADGELIVTFAPPALPVNKKEEQDLWEKKIASGLASRRDYFVEVHGMSEEEAEEKIAEIDSALVSNSQVVSEEP